MSTSDVHASIAGMLLTGGRSTATGTDRSQLWLDGERLAERLGALLARHVDLAIEIGDGSSGLASFTEPTPGAGPFAAICFGAETLQKLGAFPVPVVVLACDLPLLGDELVALLAGWPGHGAVVPVLRRRRQPLCARWAAEDLAAAEAAHEAGTRSLKGLPAGGVLLHERDLVEHDVDPRQLEDVDQPADVARLGLTGRLTSSAHAHH